MFKMIVLTGFVLLCQPMSLYASELVGQTMYSNVNIHSIKGKVVTWVNYNVDSLIPINSEITINKVNGSKLVFTVKATGQTLKLKNKQKASGLSGEAWAKKHFSREKVNLSDFTKLERNAIRDAQVRVGMSKKAVLAARGYPPAHKTPSLESSHWLYWQTRWNKIAVNFDSQGKVLSIRN